MTRPGGEIRDSGRVEARGPCGLGQVFMAENFLVESGILRVKQASANIQKARPRIRGARYPPEPDRPVHPILKLRFPVTSTCDGIVGFPEEIRLFNFTCQTTQKPGLAGGERALTRGRRRLTRTPAAFLACWSSERERSSGLTHPARVIVSPLSRGCRELPVFELLHCNSAHSSTVVLEDCSSVRLLCARWGRWLVQARFSGGIKDPVGKT